MPRCATRARPDGVPSGSASGSHRYLPRRCAAAQRAAGQGGDEVLGALEVPPDGARVAHLDRGDRAPGDPLLQAAPDDLDLGQLRHRRLRHRRTAARQAASAASCSAAFFVRPAPAAVHGPGQEDLGGEGLGVVRARRPRRRSRGRRGRGRRRAPGGWSSSPGRRRGWRPRRAAGRTAGGRSPAAVSSPQPRWTAPISASSASARIESFSRPPVVSSPRPSSRCGPMPRVAEPPGDAGQRRHVDDRGTQLGQLPLGEVRLAAVELVGDDEAEHRVAEELQALVGRQPAVLVGEGPVGQRQPEQAVGQLDAEGVAQPASGPLGVRLPTRRTHGSAVRGVRRRGPDGRRTDRRSGTPGAGA